MPRGTQVSDLNGLIFAYGTVTLLGLPFQCSFANATVAFVRSYNPAATCTAVWAAPRSLATTNGIISFPRVT